MKVFVLCLVFIMALACDMEYDNCLGSNSPYSKFGHKTLYKNVAGSIPDRGVPRACTPIFVYGLVRHGARTNDIKDFGKQDQIKKFVENLNPTGNATLCTEDMEKLQNWKVWSNEFNNKNLTAYGNEELRDLAVKYQLFIPNIPGWKNRPDKYRFTAMDKDRIVDSMIAFVESYFNYFPDVISQVSMEITDHDKDLTEETNCDKFMREVGGNKSQEEQFKRYENSHYISGIARELERRLGFPKYFIDNKLVWTLYQHGCFDEQFAKADTTPLCRIFSRQDLELLEYGLDVLSYPQLGYQNPIAHEKNCILTKEIVNLIKGASDNDKQGIDNELFGRFRFVSHGTLVSLATNMKLYPEEEAPTVENFDKQTNRHFRSSNFSPSAANIAFVLCRCDVKLGEGSMQSEYKVQIYWNEHLITSYPTCPSATAENEGLCDLEAWLNNYVDFVFGSPTECDQINICK